MPELPEVETVRRALKRVLPDKRIAGVKVRDSRLRWPVKPGRLRRLLVGQTVGEIERRAKYLLVRLEESTLIMHLGMTGKLLYLTERQPFEKHDHVIFDFGDGSELRFRDPRRFGMVDAVPNEDLETYPRLVNLGVEPLARTTSARKLHDRAKTLQRPIKNLLMDANFIVGVGNIYANEALFYAGIHPARPSAQLDIGDWQRLMQQIRRVLREAIAKGGTTLTDFVNSDGEIGYFQLSLAVYGREGEKCVTCGTRIQRTVQVGRSTYFCPKCQAFPKSVEREA